MIHIHSDQPVILLGLLVAGAMAMAPPLKFKFELEKVANALAYFASKGVQGLTKLKAVKLLYLADQRHLLRYGRPITGDRYIAMDYGPVPEGAFQALNSVLSPMEVDDPARVVLSRRIEGFRGVLHQYKYPILRARMKPDLDVFSDSDVEALDETIRDFGTKSARELVDLTHEHNAYKQADAGRPPGSSVPLPYEDFFRDAPTGGDAIREYANCQQEDRDFADALDNAGRLAVLKRKELASQ